VSEDFLMSELLTFAEIRFLLGNAPTLARVADMLPLPEGTGVAEAGLASLFARDKAASDTDGIRVDDTVRAAAALLIECDTWVDLVLMKDPAVVSMFVGSGAPGTPGVVVSAVRPGCFQLDALSPGLAAPQRLSAVMTAMLDADGAGQIYGRSHTDQQVSVAAARSQDGQWLFAREGDAAGLVAMTRDDVETRIADAFATTLVA
jgi:hypothetical protein